MHARVTYMCGYLERPKDGLRTPLVVATVACELSDKGSETKLGEY